MRRLHLLRICVICCLIGAGAARVSADDCSSAGDCTRAPGNIDAATALIAGGAALVLYNRWRRQRDAVNPWNESPCADLQRQVLLGDDTIKELERRQAEWKRPTPPPEGWRQPGTGHGPFLPATGGPLTSKDVSLPGAGGASGPGPYLPPSTGPSLKDAAAKGLGSSVPATSAAGAAPAAPAAEGRLAGVLGWTPGGKRKVMICKPIVGPDGQIRGYAMTEQEVDDVPPPAGAAGAPLQPGSDSPNTIRLPGGRRLHVDPFEEWLTGTSTVGEALARERADQQRRIAALLACQQVAAAPVLDKKPKTPVDVDALAKELDDAIKRFEELQKQLKEEAGKQLNQLAKFNEEYNAAWNKGMKGLDDYLHTYLKLLPGLKKLFEAFVDRNTAIEMGHAIDKTIHEAIAYIMLADAAVEFLGVAEWGAEGGALSAAEGAAGKGAVEGGEAAAESGLAKAAQKEAATGAEAAAKEGAEAVAAAPKPPAGVQSTGQAVETSKATQSGMSQSESPAATLSGYQREFANDVAEANLKKLVEPFQRGLKDKMCTYPTEALAKTWETGIQHEVLATAPNEARTMKEMQDLFGSHYFPVSQDPSSAMRRITLMLEQQGPGAQALIKTTRLVDVGTDAAGVTSLDSLSHSFNAVNVDGFVKFVDVGNPNIFVNPADVENTFDWWVMLLK